jgi:hypothetical protein
MTTVGADSFTAFAARRPRFIRGKLMSLSAFVGSFAPFAGDLLLSIRTH